MPETHDNEDAVVGVPYTAKFNEPLPIKPALVETVIVKVLVVPVGMVEKVKLLPPVPDESEIDEATVDETVKSLATAVVAPLIPETEMVQEIAFPARAGNPRQASVEEVVGVP